MIKDYFTEIKIDQSESCYIINDKNKIIIGKMKIIEYAQDNRSCTFRMNFYKKEDRYEYLTCIIKRFINTLFTTTNLYKINILIKESIEVQPFFDFNFHIEGIVTNNTITDCKFNNELLLGIDYDTYKNLKKVNLLTLKGKNIYLRILTIDDADMLLNYYKNNREHLMDFEELRDESFYTLKSQIKLIRQQYIELLNGNCVFFAIFLNKNIIGIIQLYNIKRGIFKDATMGYSIDEREQGKGYMKEAVKLISGYAFNTLKLHRVQATTLVHNIRSKNVLKACGFKEIGISEKYLFINGKWQDQDIFYKLNENM
ncbi:MAG: GNAT family protein [Clostridium sp.]|nr:GNAT family protein [Clostridium sp.]